MQTTVTSMTNNIHAQTFFTGGKHSVKIIGGGRHYVDVIAHRGGAGESPGETTFAFDHAKQLEADVLEMDVRSTSDDELVLMHNPTVNATTNGVGLVRCFTLKRIQQLDAGYRWTAKGALTPIFRNRGIFVPTLNQVLERYKGMRMNIEIKGWHPFKARQIGQQFCDLLKKHQMTEHVLVASFHKPVLNHVRREIPNIAISASTVDVLQFVLSTKLSFVGFSPKAPAIQICWKVIDRTMVKAAHEKGLKIHAWTVNKSEEMHRLIDLGVDGIITDYPGELIKVLASHSQIPSPY